MGKQWLLLILLSFALQSLGQKETVVPSKFIYIDPFGADRVPRKVKLGSTVKCQISNVNTFLLSGALNSSSETIDFDVPEIFTSQSGAGENADSDTVSESTSFDDFVKLFSDSGITASDKARIVYKQKQREDSLRLVFLEKFTLFTGEYSKVHQYMALEEKLRDQLKDSLFIRNIQVLKKNAESDYTILYDGITDPKKQVGLSLDRLTVIYAELNQLYNELNKTLEEETMIVNGKVVFKKDEASVESLIIRQERKKYFTDEMEAVKKVIETISDVDKKNKIIKKAQQGIDLHKKIQEEKFIAHTNAEQLNDDIVTVTPKLKYGNGQVAQEFSPIKLRTYGGWKVNFSSGYMLSFVGDDNYTLFRDSSGNVAGAIETNSSKLTHSVGGLVHVYPRFASPMAPGCALSAGLSMSSGGNLGFYGGVSVMFLEENRLVLTGGYSGVRVKRLNTANMTASGDKQYVFRSTQDNTINYDDVYKGAFFLSLTYNLSK